MSALLHRTRTLSTVFLVLLSVATSANAGDDYSSPESTLALYIDALRSGDVARVLATFDDPTGGFNLPKPLPISSYRITKRIVYGPEKVRKYNYPGIIVPARVGDIELQVLEILDGHKDMFSYNFRRIDGRWKMYSGSMWGAD
ncbi:MAG TPA: hypothetical protein VK583_07605 [Burkholderiales bacterium]|nr:hypothetical protein [Burkholderiales bacterium]